MSLAGFHDLAPWAMTLSAGAHLAGGLLLGAGYFTSLSWQADRLAAGGRARTTIAMMVLRFLVLGGLLTLVSFEGALPLLAMALGLLIARIIIMRRLREPVS